MGSSRFLQKEQGTVPDTATITTASLSRYRSFFDKASAHYRSSLFADAAKDFHKASRVAGIPKHNRLEALNWLGASYYINGRYSDAVGTFGTILDTACGDACYYDHAGRALFYQIHTLLADADIRQTKAGYLKVLTIVDAGLAWLQEIGKPKFRHPILLSKARIMAELGDYATALDFAEEAYAEKKRYGGGFYQGGYTSTIAEYARHLGNYERALQVLDEDGLRESDSHTRVKVETERIRVFLAMNPPRLAEAHTAVMKIRDLVRRIQSPLAMLEAWGETGRVCLKKGSYADALTAFREVRNIAIQDKEYHQQLLLIRAREYFMHVKETPAQQRFPYKAAYLRKTVSGFLLEITRMLAERKEEKKSAVPQRKQVKA